ncbi:MULTISPECIES: tetratricopeptide repeat protein [Streptomyces]|uniref:Tetratricopeptide repeat protein n=1 Tax=Streptomyces mutomycini TaxID=284036 RepID=A0ABW0B9H1_9ACTN|nr:MULTISPECIES: tetratricopeptide repeat protein [Streptomyces]KPC78053.1 tetratricopeptide repeat protein [Streptomyces sp. NRRL S-4]
MDQREVPGDAVMTRIGQAVMLLHAGDREEARNRFGTLWSEIGESGEALHRCTLAHYMADTQDDPGDELAWDLRALTAAEGLAGAVVTEPDAACRDATAVRALVPSLHLNLAADYVKLQRFEAARVHLDRAWDAVEVLEDDGYGGGVRAAIGRMERRMRGSAAGE